MTHGDDDGLRCPPQIAPHQVVIVPMLRDDEGDAAVLDYCRTLAAELRGQNAFDEPCACCLIPKRSRRHIYIWDHSQHVILLIFFFCGFNGFQADMRHVITLECGDYA